MSDKIAKTQPDLLYSLQVFAEAVKYDLNCHRVGKIVKFYPESLTCDIELLELKPNQGRLDKYALIQGLPLMIEGGIDTNLTFGDVTGAECLVHFNDRDIDAWFDTGEAYQPNSKRLHAFSDGFVSLRPHNKNDVFQYEIDGTVLNKGTTKIKLMENKVMVQTEKASITIDDNLIELKNTAQNLATLIQEFITACENITVNNAAPIPLTDASKAQFTTLKTQFQGLLK